MELPKLFQKKSEKSADSSRKVQKVGTTGRAGLKTAADKPARARKSETPKKAVKKPEVSRLAWMETAKEYLREVSFELRKVVWPSRKETMGSTAVVLVIVGLSASFLGVVDFVLSRLVRFLVG